MKRIILLFLTVLTAFGQPTPPATGSLTVNKTTGAITAPVSAATFRAANGIGTGAGTVTSVSVATANGVSGSVATATTTPAITLTLGAITPTSVNSIVLSGASTPTLAVTGTTTVSGTNTGDQTSVSGNAGTATALQNARTINGVSFNGTANITVTAAGSTLSDAVTVDRGGTGATTAAAAAENLGLGLTDSPTFTGVTANSVTSAAGQGLGLFTLDSNATITLDPHGEGGVNVNLGTGTGTSLTISSNTSTPIATGLDYQLRLISADTLTKRIALEAFGGSWTIDPVRSNGTPGAGTQTALISGNIIFQFRPRGYKTTAYSNNIGLVAEATENWSDSATGMQWRFTTIPNLSTTAATALVISPAAHLLLGGLTTDGTGALQFPAATTNAGGINFGTEIYFFRTGTNTATITAAGLTLSGKLTSYNSVTTAGYGVPAITAAGRVTAQSAAGNIATYTVGAADGSFEVSANMNVTAATSLITTLTCTYTDESNTARSMILPITQLTGSFIALGAITGTGAWETPVMHIRCKAATVITILTSAGTFTGVTFTAEGIIKATL